MILPREGGSHESSTSVASAFLTAEASAKAVRRKELGSSIRPAPFETVKYRLPTPDAAPWLSVTTHEIVCTPFERVVVSSVNTASDEVTPANCAGGKSDVRSARLVQPTGVPTTAPSMTTLTVPPPGTSARAVRDSTQPKLLIVPLTVSPWSGVSIAPNGVVAALLAQVIVFVPSVVPCPSASYAIAFRLNVPLPPLGRKLVSSK